MALHQPERRISIDLGEGVFIDVDVRPVLSGPSVPKPRPKLLARLVVGVDEYDAVMNLEIDVAVNHREA